MPVSMPGIEAGAGRANIGNNGCCGCNASATAVAGRSETLLTMPSGFALLSIDLTGVHMISYSSTGIIALDKATGCLILR